MVDAATRLFLERGVGATSTDALAAEARVSKRTLYARYSSKHELLADVLRRQLIRLTETPSPTEGPLDTVDRLRPALLDLALRTVATVMQPGYLALLRTILAESRDHPELAQLFRSTAPPLASAAVVEILSAARAQGSVVVDDLDAAARLFLGPILTFALLDGLFLADREPQVPEPAQIEHLVDLYLRAVGAP